MKKTCFGMWCAHGEGRFKMSAKSLKYLKQRCITQREIIRYQIGYCDDGLYQNRVIIPSYDKEGNINYFIARII